MQAGYYVELKFYQNSDNKYYIILLIEILLLSIF